VGDRAASVLARLSVGASVALALPALTLATRTYPSVSELLSSGSVLNAVLSLAFASVGALIVARRPDNRIGWLLCVEGVINGVGALATQYARYTLQTDPGVLPGGLWARLGSWSWIPGLGLLAFLLLLFPDGRLPSRHWRPMAWLAVSWIISHAVILAVRPGSGPVTAEAPAANPVGISDPHAVFMLASFLILAVVLLGSLASLAARFRRATGREREQLKWFLYSAGILAAVFLATLPLRGSDALRPWIAGLVLVAGAFLPVSVGIAILRHRLYDIDQLISRTLAFAVLWLLIALVYVGLAAALGIFAGSRLPVEVAVACTLAATLVFQPARRGLERLADRWVFGERLGGYDLLTRFGAALESAIDQHELGPRLAAMVRQGLDVQWVRVTVLRASGEETIFDQIGANGIEPHERVTPAATAPLVHGRERIGAIECGPKRDGPFSAKDHEVLTSIGRQAALSIRNAALTAELAQRLAEIQQQARELAASRTRLVQAEEAGRRRIERDIHDGVQQQLVALLAKLRLARNQLARDQTVAERTLAELQEDARQALDDLRELARGIHPPVLSDRGLLEAIEARVARLPMEVRIETDGLARGARLPEGVEGAAYFVVCEGLANALKHAAAHHATVRLASTSTNLNVEVTDDGRGFDVASAAGSGLRGLADRIEALGGTLQVTSRPGVGTCLGATLPLVEVSRG
jgi:signal transduction histidine kinase